MTSHGYRLNEQRILNNTGEMKLIEERVGKKSRPSTGKVGRKLKQPDHAFDNKTIMRSKFKGKIQPKRNKK